jgi:hypothetical protein
MLWIFPAQNSSKIVLQFILLFQVEKTMTIKEHTPMIGVNIESRPF